MDEEAAVGLVDGVDVVPDMEFNRSISSSDPFSAVCRKLTADFELPDRTPSAVATLRQLPPRYMTDDSGGGVAQW